MPKRTLELLETLESYGLTDDDFDVVHHREGITIHAHRAYCERTGEFQSEDSTNAGVRARLELMVGALRGGAFTKPARPGVLKALAQAAHAEVPN